MRSVSLALALWLLPLGLLAAEGEAAAEKRVLTGTYTSAFNDRPNRLRITFLPTAEPERWQVLCDFSFNSSWRTWKGIAEGGFETGRIAGLVRSEDGSRVFTFRLEREKKRFKGTHFEVVGGRERKSGTLTLKG